MRLLATVLSASEASRIAGLVDLLDVKDPSNGALGAPDVETVRGIKGVIGSGSPLSVALGDCAPDGGRTIELGRLMAAAGATIVKVGLADIDRSSAVKVLRKLKNTLPAEVRLVAAAYADAAGHGFFSPFDLPGLAKDAGADGILVDTCDKSGKNLFDFLSMDELNSIVSEARSFNLMTALAGSLCAEDIDELSVVAPDWVGFRSAITTNGNRGEPGVDPLKVMRLKDCLGRAPVGSGL